MANEIEASDSPRIEREVMRPLTAREERFAQAYAAHLELKAAAKAAGMQRRTAAEMLASPVVMARIDEICREAQRKAGLTAELVCEELRRLVTVNVRDLFDHKGRIRAIPDLPVEVAAAISQFEVERTLSRDGESMTQTVKVRMYDKLGAIQAAMRRLGLFAEDNAQTRNSFADALAFIASNSKGLPIKQ